MEWQHHLPTYPLQQTSQTILLKAESGQARRKCLQQWLQAAVPSGTKTWLLMCDRTQIGPWAGVNDLFQDLVPDLQTHAPDLISKHDYELTNILPGLRQTITVRNPTLTDVAAPQERVRNYPADRALRIVHGLIDLLNAWHQRSGQKSSWMIACDQFDCAGALAQKFFVEFIRRAEPSLNLTLLLAIAPTTTQSAAEQFKVQLSARSEMIGVQLALPPDPPAPVCQQEMHELAQHLTKQVAEDLVQLEIHVPQLIHHWLLSDQPENALIYQIRACSIYTTRGFYQDALVYGEAALAHLEQSCPEDIQKRWNLSIKLFNCYAGLDKPEQAWRAIASAMTKTNDPEHLFQGHYMLAMMHARYLPQHDFGKAEAHLEQGLAEIARTSLPEHMQVFHTAFNRNGLALIRHRQGRPEEAMQICQSCYEQLNAYLKPDQHRLHRSVLLYNIAQVYTSLGANHEAVAYLTAAIAMDPNYSEYYNDRGNLYLKMGRLEDALSDYLKAIELSPPYPEVWSNLGHCYQQLNQIERAIDAYSRCLDLDPNQFSVLVARAGVFEQLNQLNTALVDYNAALNLNPEQPLLLANRAVLHYQMEHLTEALRDLNQAIALSPETSELYQNRAIALMDLGRGNEAVEDLQTYLKLNPDAEDRQAVEQQLRFAPTVAFGGK